MELALPTPVSRPPCLEWSPRTAQRTQGAKVAKVADHHLKEKTEWWACHSVHGRHSREGGQDTGESWVRGEGS
jgi:hypothetical protein